MLLALIATALVAVALLSEELIPKLDELWTRHRARRRPDEKKSGAIDAIGK